MNVYAYVIISDPLWLQTFPLDPNTVLDYFSNSPFYDRSSNNEVLKMQRRDMSHLKSAFISHFIWRPHNFPCRHMTGIEFSLLHFSPVEAPPTPAPAPPGSAAPVSTTSSQKPPSAWLYVIQKSVRESPFALKPLAIYYVIDGVIYMAPTLQRLIIHRMVRERKTVCCKLLPQRRSVALFRDALSDCTKRIRFDLVKGHYWDGLANTRFVSVKGHFI